MHRERAMVWALLFPLSGLVACAETSEAVRADPRVTAQVQVSKLEPGPACQPLGAIDASSGECQQNIYESAYEALRNKAALRNSNYVVIDSISGPHALASSSNEESTVVIQGRLFSCPAGPAAARAPLPPTARSYAVADHWPILPAAPLPPLTLVGADGSCEPSCSPGFICSHGSCVTACNPSCDQGQHCGEDRICH